MSYQAQQNHSFFFLSHTNIHTIQTAWRLTKRQHICKNKMSVHPVRFECACSWTQEYNTHFKARFPPCFISVIPHWYYSHTLLSVSQYTDVTLSTFSLTQRVQSKRSCRGCNQHAVIRICQVIIWFIQKISPNGGFNGAWTDSTCASHYLLYVHSQITA